jgi:hypothetical protein
MIFKCYLHRTTRTWAISLGYENTSVDTGSVSSNISASLTEYGGNDAICSLVNWSASANDLTTTDMFLVLSLNSIAQMYDIIDLY